ncbi:MAG: DUF378 domain-containing protein [Patescibacteria group bacterium]
MKVLHIVTFVLIIVGALNWGLVGLFDFNLVMRILGGAPGIEKLVYILVGISAVVEIFTHSKTCRMCKPDSPPSM